MSKLCRSCESVKGKKYTRTKKQKNEWLQKAIKIRNLALKKEIK